MDFLTGNATLRLNSFDDVKQLVQQLYASKSVHTVPPTNIAEEWWLSFVLQFGDFNCLLVFYMFMNFCYFIGGLLFWMIDRTQLLDRFKVQRDKYATNIDYWFCIKNLVQNYIFVIVPLIYAVYPLSTAFLGLPMALPLPGLASYLCQVFFCILVEDVGHYWLHRMLHIPFLYKRIHKVHHRYAAPFGLSASYAHPLEVIILGIPTFLGPFILQTHYIVFFSFILYRQLDAVATHSGYDLPHPLDILSFHGGIKMHDYHHKTFNCNYSSRFTYMDKFFGTYKEGTSSEETIKGKKER
eukprot:TRINITY_DN1289_c0_g1_i1.p1 TRINITY_DN1289_c0_g1~~TRINITY_DN1289_c0_g1_i1.p1  ORF type:complete len:297 (+),score=47.82 TRINITY_DN1289_c0_g1_i1:104-994(+)